MRLSEIAAAADGEYFGDNVSVTASSIDTRSLKSGDIFIALHGPSFDGHDYLSQAVRQGCIAVIVDHFIENSDIPQLVVKDTRIALGLFAEAWRQQFADLTVIAVTGSCGKTTVKEMLAAILSQTGPTLSTMGNLNNDIGVPLTLLRIKKAHRFAVIELGASGMKEIAYTAKLSHPDVALITNVAAVHTEGFGSLANVAKEKSEIFRALSKKGTAVINCDDPFSSDWLGIVKACRTITSAEQFSTDKVNRKVDFSLAEIERTENGRYHYTIASARSKIKVHSQLLGFHNVKNGLLAAATASACGSTDAQIKAGLDNVKPAPGRLNLCLENSTQLVLIDDTYNASPHSVRAAIDLLAQYQSETLLILGDMGELGSDSKKQHCLVGEWADKKGITEVVAVGEYAENVVAGFGKRAMSFKDQIQLINALDELLKKGMTVLVKGSRFTKMENVVQAIKDKVI